MFGVNISELVKFDIVFQFGLVDDQRRVFRREWKTEPLYAVILSTNEYHISTIWCLFNLLVPLVSRLLLLFYVYLRHHSLSLIIHSVMHHLVSGINSLFCCASLTLITPYPYHIHHLQSLCSLNFYHHHHCQRLSRCPSLEDDNIPDPQIHLITDLSVLTVYTASRDTNTLL